MAPTTAWVSSGAATVPVVTDWQYTTRVWDPTLDGDEEDWARAIAADGWRTWLGHPGSSTTINARQVRVWSLRRLCRRPFSVHDHAATCVGTQPAVGH